jgi:putative nucleotidyltransferase with HDIG domain
MNTIPESKKEVQSPFPLPNPGDTGKLDLSPSTEALQLILGLPGNPDGFKSTNGEEIFQDEADTHSFPHTGWKDADDIVSFWERGFWENRKISLAREVLMRLDQRYRQVFTDQEAGHEMKSAKKEAFFSSNLLYLIAITDGNEDTLGHSQLVSKYSVLFARELGIEDQSFLVDLERGALLHDIGKIGVPEFVLRKEGALTQREREVVREHPLLGFEMIKGFDFLADAAHVILYHHERYDGTGYPFRLKGEEIPLGARIFALADTLDAITSDRPYRKGKNFDDALMEIKKGKDTQFDPLLTEVFLSVPREKWEEIKENHRASLPLSAVH